MKVHMDFTDGATDIFQELSKISFGLVKEGLSRASSQLAKTYVQTIESEAPSEWGSINEGGKRRLSLEDKKAKFGEKHSKKTGDPIQTSEWKKGNIAENVKFYTPPELDKMYAVVGGGHPTFRPIRYENGVAVGYKKRVTSTSQETLAILDGLNDGKVIILSEKSRRFLMKSKGMSNFPPRTVKIRPRHFAEEARAKGANLAMEKVKKLYDANFPKAIANIKVKEWKVKVS